jgi:endonuclease/exonuclease/phosphatase family metal-dependent hydrolase
LAKRICMKYHPDGRTTAEKLGMATFGFWNIDSLRNLQTDERNLPQIVADLALERSLDVLFLIECQIPYELLLAAFKTGPEYHPIPCGDRFKVLARFDPKLMQPLPPPVPSDRFEIWHLSLPLQEDVLMCVVHGLDKRNNSTEKQGLFLQQVVAALSYHEKQIGHDRSLVLGDFNANPFESPMASVLGMNAVISQAIARSDPRRILNQQYSYFYNPTWNLYGDSLRGSAPATYYYRGSDPHELYWHMLDQVLIRPSLIDRFEFSALDIVTSVRNTKLTGTKGIPDRKRFSDHLPFVFGVDLSNENDQGAKNV